MSFDFASFLKDTPSVAHKVQDQSLDFYPVSWADLFEIKEVIKSIGSLVSVFTQDTRSDTGTASRSIDGMDEVIVEAAEEGVIRLRTEQRQKAVDSLMTVLTSRDTLKSFAKVISKSLKADIPPEEIMDKIPAPAMVDMIIGVMKANKGVLGPLTGALEGRLGAIEAKLSAQMDSKTPEAGVAGTIEPDSNESTSKSESPSSTGEDS